jgi:hypothetical protein
MLSLTPGHLLAVVLQTVWVLCLCLVTLRTELMSATFVVLSTLTLGYAAATALLAQRRRLGWQLSFSLSLTTSVLSFLWTLASLVAYWGGSTFYKDSPASVIAAVLAGVFGLLPSIVQAILLWATRGSVVRPS